MKKSFVFIFTVFMGLLFIFASGPGSKMVNLKDLDLNGKPKDIQPGGGVKGVQPDINFGKIPLYFITNKGQVNGRTKFYAKASRYTLWLTKGGLVFDSFKKVEVEDNDTPHPLRGHPSQERHTPPFGNPSQEGNNRGFPHSTYSPHSPKFHRDVSRLIFLNANKNPEMVPIDETKLRVNYFIGNDRSKWHCDVPTSQVVLYKNLYKNIDLKVYGIEKQIEYDWIVKPGGNPGDISFEYKNVKGTRIDDEGNLLIKTEFGELIHKKPNSYQIIGMEEGSGANVGVDLRVYPLNNTTDNVKRNVNVKFKKIGKNTYGFGVGEYDKSRELIIDPVVLAYSTYLGGDNADYAYGIAVDTNGYIYVTGFTYSIYFPILNQYQIYPWDFKENVFVTKIDTNQEGASSLIHSTYLGGEKDDYGYGIAVDSSGNAYVTGFTNSMDFPTTMDPYQSDLGGNIYDAFITKIDTTQSGASSLIYSTYLGGNNDDRGFGIAVDSSENAYVTGITWSTDFPTRNPYQPNLKSDMDAFVTKIDTTQSGASSLIYSTYLGGNSDDRGHGIAVDSSGNAYVTGDTLSTDFPTFNKYQDKQAATDAFVTKLDTTQSGASSLIYSTYLGGNSGDRGLGIAVDSSGNAYVTGDTHSTDFPTFNKYQDKQAASDAFVTKLDTTQSGASSLIYSTYLGGNSDDVGFGIAVGNIGYAYVTGYACSTDFPTFNPYQTYPGGGSRDVFVTKIDTTKNYVSSLIYSTYLGGNSMDCGVGIAVDSSGNAYVTGNTDSTDFPTMNQYQTYQGSVDAFVTKLTTLDPPAVITTEVSSITAISAVSGGDVTSDGGGFVTARGVCWNTSSNPTIADSHTVDGTGTGAFTSAISGLTSNTFYYVRAYATNSFGTAYGNEVTFTTAAPSITVISPNGGENWEIGSKQDITWSTMGLVDYVKIEYSEDNGSEWIPIVSATENDGTYAWTVANTPSTQCLVRVYEIDGEPVDTSDDAFSIVPVPTITVTSPNGGENWALGSTQNITWDASNVSNTVKITLRKDGGLIGIIATDLDPTTGSYAWTVGEYSGGTAPEGTGYKVKIKEKGTTVSDTSDASFTLSTPPSITVISPNGSENWEVGSQQTITWTSIGTVGNVKIEYSTNNGDNWIPIIESMGNVGTHPWIVPPAVSDQCLIRVSETDGDPSDTSDNVFSIVPIPKINVTSPNGSEEWEVNSQQTITWTNIGTVGNVRIEYSTNNGDNWKPIIASTGNDGTHPWTVPYEVSSQCLIRVSETDGSPSDVSNSVFSIVPIPTITVTSPNGGENWEVGSQQTITWTTTGNVSSVIIEYTTNRGASWIAISPSTENDGSYKWEVPNKPSEHCFIRISKSDADKSVSDVSNREFSITSPYSGTVTVTSPNGGETLTTGSIHEITWTSTGNVSNVMIEYSTDRGSSWTTVFTSTINDSSYNWTIPNVPDTSSDNCLVRITGIDWDEGPSDVSNAVFSIVPPISPTITIASPNGGEHLIARSTYNIMWTYTGTIGNVRIQYSTNNGGSWRNIVASTINSGIYSWIIPRRPSDNCLIRISETDGEPSDVSDAVFSIVLPPSITIISPNGGESWEAGFSRDITWTSSGNVGNLKIEYSIDNGASWATIESSAFNDGSFNWIVPDSPSNNCLVRISDSDSDGIPTDVSNAVFSIVPTSSPTVAVTSPNGGETLKVGSKHEITWTSAGLTGNVKIEYSFNGGSYWATIIGSTANDSSHNWRVPDEPSDNCLVRISDIDGDPLDVSDASFSIVSPSLATITVASPNGGENIPAGSTHEITWTSTGTIGNVIIQYSKDNGATWMDIINSTVNDGSFDWVVPDTLSDTCLVRIGGNDSDEDPWDVSDEAFSIVSPIPGTITVIFPNGGETCEAGSIHEITWTSSGPVETVKIEYSTHDGIPWTPIVESMENSGSYNWIVPDTPSDNCLVRISSIDGDMGPSDVSDGVFSIVSPSSPIIIVTSPNGGESLTSGITHAITWASAGDVGDVMIEYSTDSGASWDEIIDSIPNEGIFEWTVPDTPSENCLVRIIDTSGDPWDVSDAEFSIVSPSPATVTVTSPNGGESLTAGSTYEITWASTGDIKDVSIEYSLDSGNSWAEIIASTSNEGSYEWTVPYTFSDNCLVRITGIDVDGDPSDVSDVLFSIALN